MSSVDEDLERRLDNWSRWYYGGGGSFGVASIYGFGVDHVSGHRRYSETPMPVINGEAIDTHWAIHSIDGSSVERPLRDALWARYLRLAPSGYEIRSLSEIQVASALYVSYDTYLRRLGRAKRALREHLLFGRLALSTGGD